MLDIGSKLLSWLLEHIDAKTIRTIFRLFRPVILVLIPVSVVTSGLLFYRMVTRIRNGDRIVTNTIVAKYESTAEPYKALEALVLNGLDKESKLGSMPVSDETVKHLNSLMTITPSAVTDKKPPVKFTSKTKEETGRPYLIAEGSRNFILTTSKALPDNFDSSQSADDAFAVDTKLKRTIESMLALDDKLCPFNGKPLAPDLPPVVQTYVISEKNVIALCSAEEAQNRDYETDYAGDRDFVSTQYWKDTVKTDHPPSTSNSNNIDGYFHVTPSYIDSAGNGIVRSYCRDVIVPPSTKRNAMICFDTATPTTLQSTTDKMQAFAGDVSRVKCDSSGCTSADNGAYEILESVSPRLAAWLFPAKAELHDIGERKLADEYGEAQHKQVLEDVSGHLHVLAQTDDSAMFSIPFGKGPLRSNFFLLSEIRFGVFQQSSFHNGLWAGGCLIFALLLLVGSFVETAFRLDQQKQVRERINDLMSKVPIAFCSGDGTDVIQFVNPAFAELLGYRNAEAALDVLGGKTFDKLLFSDEDLKIYRKIKRHREHGEFSQVYDVSLTKENLPVPVKVFSTSLPNAANSIKKGFETFGLFFPKGG